ncbi:hypothetical protein [Bradyrhizobium sp. BWA-3-5]|uniref:hypothetical protein n=1 Tax=Bradyrhizobium sp. BWA-3-5 TaxID=3080013 RepID=UPI00293F37EA|nr:hypothetical protein [Bradyrhizobium sp. BWA-3-5]WOH68669.1 hypothetical protein RX331_13575 [Bradyrhizobium sp. BWA-3-5]
MSTFANTVTRGDGYLISKFSKLQVAARLAQAEISAIPETARPDEEHEAILWAIAPVERLAKSMSLYEASTQVGAQMLQRVSAWLDGNGLDCFLEPLEIAA